MRNAVIIIPALNPDEKLIKYCNDLIEADFQKIILVDDGSDEEHRPVFDTLKALPQCSVLRHAVNLGKGRALKNAFNYFLNMENRDNFSGVITADSDGQHRVEDVIKIQEALSAVGEVLILGARDFNSDNVPPKSRFGNKNSIFLLRLLHGMKLQDTQTGLRGIPTTILPKYLDIFGERFEYETGMLVATARCGIKYLEIPIETIYENENKGTHFRPIKDSLAVLSVLLGTFFKYMISSILSFLIDIGIFKLMLVIIASLNLSDGKRILIATVVSRVLSSLFNFTVNKNVVFDSKANKGILLLKYYILCVIQMGCSAGLVTGLFMLTHLPETVVKIIIDAILFIISYHIQRKFIFNK